jgi:hypothetical protein
LRICVEKPKEMKMSDIEEGWEFKLSWRGGSTEYDDGEKNDLLNNDGKIQN